MIKPRIDLSNRIKLEKFIPLKAPLIINVDPSSNCQFACKFCPTGDKKLINNISTRKNCLMSYELFQKIINDILKFKKPIKVLRLYKDGEPLLNPNFSKMVKYAKEKKCAEKIDTTTNGAVFTEKIIDDIIKSGIDRINISVQGVNKQNYLNFSGYNINFDFFVKNIEYLYKNKGTCEIIIKTNGDLLSDLEKNEFYKIFSPFSDGIYIEHLAPCWPNYDIKDFKINSEVDIYGNILNNDILVCPYPFYSISINSSGNASLCFLDWKHELTIGDVNNESIYNIWNGDKLKNYQLMFLNKKRKSHAICGNCGQLKYGCPDNLDKYAENLLQKIQ